MAYIKAIYCHAPNNVLTNETLQSEFPNDNIEKISKSVGVSNRHIAEQGETAADLACKAAEELFAANEISKETIDFVVFATQSPDQFMPSTACVIQNKLGLPTTCGAFTFDLGCSAYVYGLAICKSFVDSGLAKNVLLLTGDTISKYLHPQDKNRILFGDAASATLISTDGIAEIGETVYGTDGSGADSLIIKNGGCRHPERTNHEETDEEGLIRRDDFFFMNGADVFNFTIDCVPNLIEKTITKNQLTNADIDGYVLHQANKFILNAIRKACKIDKEKFHIGLEQTGNTTSSSIPLILSNLGDKQGGGEFTFGRFRRRVLLGRYNIAI